DNQVKNAENALNSWGTPSIPATNARAEGGIITRPEISLIGEAGREAVIPLEDRARGIPLWIEAGREMGLLPVNVSNLNSINSPNTASYLTTSHTYNFAPGISDTHIIQPEDSNVAAHSGRTYITPDLRLATEAIRNTVNGQAYSNVSALSMFNTNEDFRNTSDVQNFTDSRSFYPASENVRVFPHAIGGIFSAPHVGLVAEAGREAIIPLERQTRGATLWMQVGRELGLMPDSTIITNSNYNRANLLSYNLIPEIVNALMFSPEISSVIPGVENAVSLSLNPLAITVMAMPRESGFELNSNRVNNSPQTYNFMNTAESARFLQSYTDIPAQTVQPGTNTATTNNFLSYLVQSMMPDTMNDMNVGDVALIQNVINSQSLSSLRETLRGVPSVVQAERGYTLPNMNSYFVDTGTQSMNLINRTYSEYMNDFMMPEATKVNRDIVPVMPRISLTAETPYEINLVQESGITNNSAVNRNSVLSLTRDYSNITRYIRSETGANILREISTGIIDMATPDVILRQNERNTSLTDRTLNTYSNPLSEVINSYAARSLSHSDSLSRSFISGRNILTDITRNYQSYSSIAGAERNITYPATNIQNSTINNPVADMAQSVFKSFIVPHAEGGIFSAPHIGLIAEAGREAVIPLEDKTRGIPLLMAAMSEIYGGDSFSNVFNSQQASQPYSLPLLIQNTQNQYASPDFSAPQQEQNMPVNSRVDVRADIKPADIYIDGERIGSVAFRWMERHNLRNGVSAF
ncbi:MAG: hypothetical protein IJQ58_12165, partial [Synergistaceae bacterium]|nr:hypothetical protein [Synergistaceae bacterium]